MRDTRNKLIIYVVFSTLLIFPGWAASEQLVDFNGKPQSLSDHAGKGKWLVVMLWASDCHVCNAESQQYVKFHEKHNGKDATIVGISLDGAAKKKDAEAFIKRNGINFPSLIGEPESVMVMYQDLTGADWVGTPSFMVYNPKGELIGAQAGAVPPSIIESFIERESTTNKPAGS